MGRSEMRQQEWLSEKLGKVDDLMGTSRLQVLPSI